MNAVQRLDEAKRLGYFVVEREDGEDVWAPWARYCDHLRIPNIVVQRYGGSSRVLVIVATILPQRHNVRSIVEREFTLARKKHRPARIKIKEHWLQIDGLPHELACATAATLAEMTGAASYLAQRAQEWPAA